MTTITEEIIEIFQDLQIPWTKDNLLLLKDIYEWMPKDSVAESLRAFYSKVTWQGADYFFEYYTNAFNHWDDDDRNLAIRIAKEY